MPWPDISGRLFIPRRARRGTWSPSPRRWRAGPLSLSTPQACDDRRPDRAIGHRSSPAQTETADLVLKVLDRSEPLRDDDHVLINRPVSSLVVASKADLPPAWEPCDRVLAGAPVVIVSAERSEGLDLLIAAIVAALVPIPPEPGPGVPFRPAQLERLQRARDALRGRPGDGDPGDRRGEPWNCPGLTSQPEVSKPVEPSPLATAQAREDIANPGLRRLPT